MLAYLVIVKSAVIFIANKSTKLDTWDQRDGPKTIVSRPHSPPFAILSFSSLELLGINETLESMTDIRTGSFISGIACKYYTVPCTDAGGGGGGRPDID